MKSRKKVERKLLNQKGISLVALIITIIVMVILAGIIIVSAVADGGVIDRAQQAIKENERAEAEELVIASYVYEKVASEKTVAVLDLDATADAIYENLTANGFTLPDAIDKTDESGNVVTDENGENIKTLKVVGNEIDLNIQGKHGDYDGTVTDKGLEDDLEIKDSNNTTEPTKTDLEILRLYLNGKTFSTNELGTTQELSCEEKTETITVQFGSMMYMTDTTGTEIFCEVIYNGNKYTVCFSATSQTEARVNGVEIQTETTFYYGEEYIYEEDESISMTVYENGTVVQKQNSNSYEMTEYVYIYENKAYALESGKYVYVADITDGGKVVSMDNGNMKYVYLIEKFEIDSCLFYDNVAEPDGTFSDAAFKSLSNMRIGMFITKNLYGSPIIVSDNGIAQLYIPPIKVTSIGGFSTLTDFSTNAYSKVGEINQNTLELSITTTAGVMESGTTFSNSSLPKYNKEIGKEERVEAGEEAYYEIYDTETPINVKWFNAEFDGTASYWIYDEKCYLLIKYNEAYILGNSNITYTLDRENNKFTVSEYTIDDGATATGNTLEYTIGTDMFKVE